jgi:flotillin
LAVEADGQAAAIRARGEAEAEIIFKKGEADAKARHLQAAAYQAYTQAAIVDKLIALLPEIVTAMATPLSQVDKITVVSTGDGAATGVHKVVGDLTTMAAQVPTLFETLSGLKLSELLSHLPTIGQQPATATSSNSQTER